MEGKILGNRYKILNRLGGGGMSEVYKGLDTLLDRQVTVKILRQQYASAHDFVRKFRREAQAVARLSHPNIVSIYDVSIEGDLHYLVMEYIEGINLKEYIINNGPLNQNDVINIGLQICDALEHAHTNQIIHRDIKPHNILITDTGKVKITDFGIAQAASEATITYAEGLVGSVHYLSPEQAKGEVTGYKSDIYSAGVVLYELITGQVPYEGESPIAIALKHIQEVPKKPTAINSTISKDLEEIILKAMAKDKNNRFESAAQLKSQLEKLRNKAGFSVKDELEIENVSKQKLKPAAWVLIAFLIMSILVGSFVLAKEILVVEVTEVPSLIGKSVQEAAFLLQKNGLKLEIDGEKHHSTIPKNHIIDQNPKEESSVRSGRTVKVEVSLGQKQIAVPNVIGDSLRIARIKIENVQLTVNENIEEIFSSDYPEGRVIGQSPLGDMFLDVGAEVNLVVSRGSKPQVVDMPDLKGKTLAEAENILREYRLDLGMITYRDSSTYFTGQVISQDVEAATEIMQGNIINLVVSRGPGPKEENVTITLNVIDDGQEHIIKIFVEDLKGTRQEYSQKHQPGDFINVVVPFYGNGEVQIYQDDVLIYKKKVPS